MIFVLHKFQHQTNNYPPITTISTEITYSLISQ